MFNLHSLSINHPVKTIVLFVLVTMLLAGGFSRLEVRNSFDGDLPKDHPINIQIEKVKQVYGERNIVLLGIVDEDIYSTGSLELIQELTVEVAEIPYVLPDEIKSLATIDNVSEREWGVHSEGFLDHLPASEEEKLQLKNDVRANDLVHSKLISEDGTMAVIMAPLDDDFEGGEVYDALQKLVEDYRLHADIYISGAPVLVEDVQRGIGADSRRFMGIAILLIFFGFYLCFRNWRGVLLPLTMVVLSIIWTMGTMGYLSLDITVVSNALPVIMIAVASSYGIHFMNAYLNLAPDFETREELVLETIDQVGLPILITGITSALGSLSLLVFKIDSLQEFGFIGAIGFCYATLICLMLLPALCMLIKRPTGNNRRFLDVSPVVMSLTKLVLAHRLKFMSLYTILVPLCIWGSTKISIGDDYMKFFPKSHQGRQAGEIFSNKLNGVRVMNIMVTAESEDGIKDVDFYDKLRSFEDDIKGLADIGSVSCYTGLVTHFRSTFDNENVESITSDDIAQYLMLYEMSSTPGEQANYYDENYQSAHVQVLLSSSNPEIHRQLYDRIVNIATQYFDSSNIAFGGDVMHRIVLGEYIITGKIQNIIMALIIVLFTTLLIFRSWRKGLQTLIPILLSMIMVFGLMGAIGIRLGISTSLLTAMIVGIGVDFAIHYLISFYKNNDGSSRQSILQTSRHTGQAISYDALSNIIGFSVLSFSGFLPIQHFGWLLAFSMLLIYVNTLVVFPILFGTADFSKSNSFSYQINMQ